MRAHILSIFALCALLAPAISRADAIFDSELSKAIEIYNGLPYEVQTEILSFCVDCSVQDGPAAVPAGKCDGVCPNQGDVCVPKIGNAARPQTTPGRYCECVPKAEEDCGYNEDVRGKKKYRWAYPDGGSCKFGKCPDGKSCTSGTQANGDPMCECK